MTKKALVLSGGGARGAYQVGVLKAIADMHEKNAVNPFAIISGTSSGAINAVALAASANNFRLAVKKVERIWRQMHVEDVYRASWLDLMRSTARLVFSLFNKGVGRDRPLALLDNAPLRGLLEQTIQFRNIQKRIDAGFLDAVSVNATGYSSGDTVSFFQGHPDQQAWRRGRRVGTEVELNALHLMASSAIPTIFPAQKVGREYFGDGALRQLAPMSPALKLGAEKILAIGVSGNEAANHRSEEITHSPSLAQLFGHIFNSAFVDSLDHDINTMVRINELIGMTENEAPYTDLGPLRAVDLLAIYPTIEFDEIAARHIHDLPPAMRRFMQRTGAGEAGSAGSFASYLLFEPDFCRELIDHGYRDTMAQEETVRAFFDDDQPVDPAFPRR